MGGLGTTDFSRFFEALWGVPPFPWQRRLMRAVADEKSGWPSVLDLPTGSGKTAVLDIALFHLAIEARRNGVRRAPRRIVMVVDRRTIVDQAHERAMELAEKLKNGVGILNVVATALRSLTSQRGGGESPPLECFQMRGGVYRDPSWARTPDQPLIITSTVDQVGSRLLFRGYGVSESMRPVHTGLLANDSLIILDECHLSRPFEQTLGSLEHYRSRADVALEVPWGVVRLSATPTTNRRNRHDERTEPFSLSDDDRRHPALAKRLGAHKPARIEPILMRGEEGQKRELFALKCAEWARRFIDEESRTVAVIVNRVDTARRVHEALTIADSYDVELLTGRMRPFDRDEVVSRIRKRVQAGMSRQEGERPLVVVATQSIEAGADFDFDALVTECASLPALRQRFGRVDRRGEYRKARAVILARSDQVEEDDPVYGRALAETWNWLRLHRDWDFGDDHLRPRLPKGAQEQARLSESGRGDFWLNEAPVLLPGHLDAWAQTSPGPRSAEPDVSLWLHGLSGRPADVQIIWRADISEDDFQPAGRERLLNILSACPPSSAEAMAVPFIAARNWLRGAEESDVVDVEGGVDADPETREPRGARPRRAIRWRGDDSDLVSSPTNGKLLPHTTSLRPGDTIVVPASYGGLGKHRNWEPGAKTPPVVDLGDIVQLPLRGRAVLRLHPEVLTRLGLSSLPPALPEDASPRDERAIVERWLQERLAAARAEPNRPATLDEAIKALESLLGSGWRLVTPAGTLGGLHRVLVGHRPKATTIQQLPASTATDVSSEPEISSFTAAEVTLEDHSAGVKAWAETFAQHCGLRTDLADDLALAAWLHDVGKADRRFQAWLRGGDEVAVAGDHTLIAKSTIPHMDRPSRERARALSRYPQGGRHEMLSVALVEGHPDLRKRAHDWDLVLHLIASHHGHARPFAPAIEDREDFAVACTLNGTRLVGRTRHRLAQLDSPITERFWRLTHKYGWFGLAWLEAILRLADHRRSQEEAEKEGRG